MREGGERERERDCVCVCELDYKTDFELRPAQLQTAVQNRTDLLSDPRPFTDTQDGTLGWILLFRLKIAEMATMFRYPVFPHLQGEFCQELNLCLFLTGGRSEVLCCFSPCAVYVLA